MTPTTTSFAILGLLSERPMSGYDVLAATKLSIGQFWSMSRAGIYRELERLERLGYVTGSDVAQRDRPHKRIYEPSAAGRDALQEWLDSADLDDEGPRVSFLVRIFFGRRMRRSSVEKLLADVAARTQRDLDALVAVHEQLGGSRLVFERLTARHGVLAKQARLAWIAEAREALGIVGTESR
jgi:DNA-binding PadR family transcriptional regulator